MGDVYRALDPRLEREVAIKVIRSLASNSEAQARLWREARAAASVSHPGICQIYDVGESDDQLFIVMELLSGQSLASRLKDGAIKPDEAVTTSLGILGALGALHSRQIVHRDLKPSNVFLSDGGIKLLDFGLARSRQSIEGVEQTLTQDRNGRRYATLYGPGAVVRASARSAIRLCSPPARCCSRCCPVSPRFRATT